jgi:shikimate dehydrogenase
MSFAEPTFTLDDLARWSHHGTALAVLGHPINHSVSPAMHNAALAAMAHADQAYQAWKYFRFDVPPERLSEALGRLHAAGFLGLNLTVPHKVLAFDLIKEVDPTAVGIGAVNTLRRTAEGWRGFNTDGHGLARALADQLGIGLANSSVVLLGAGGAARGAALECLRRQCRGLWIGNRTAATRHALVNELGQFAGNTVLHSFDPANPPSDLPGGVIVINATSLGLKAGDPAPMDLHRLPPGAKVYDMVYNSPQTALLRDAAALGLPHANGLSMLVHQGARSLEIWTGATVPVAVMQAAATAALS